jgi:hypothetical protein
MAGHVHGGIHVNNYPKNTQAKPPPGVVSLRWAGTEPIADFTRWNRLYQGFTIVTMISLPICSVLSWLGVPRRFSESEQSQLLLISIIVGVVSFVVLWGQAKIYGARLQKRMSPWAVHAGPVGIQTASQVTEYALRWDQITSTEIMPIKADPTSRGNAAWPYVFLGLHVRLAPGAAVPRIEHPVGWPVVGGLPKRRNDGWIPLCVLGPLTTTQAETFGGALHK